MPLFIPIHKIDEEKRIVYGRAADETPDRQGEIWDYESNKPLWQAWSQAAAKATEAAGQEVSLGNVRAMHGPKAAGKVAEIDFDDAAKAMDIGAKIVDDGEWEKCKQGVYTGFSVGGNYVKKWADAVLKAFKRVTIEPHEISLADLPANPSSMFTAVKANGIVEQRAFKVAERQDVSPKEGESQYGDVEFADAKNKKYPIDTEAHIRAAWNYINKAKNQSKYSAEDVKTIKAKIVAAWKKKIDKDGPPSASEKTLKGDAHKTLWDVQSLANILQSLKYIHESVLQEREREGDDSDVPERLGDAVSTLADVFLEMAQEEVSELLDGIEPEGANEGE